MKRTAKLGRVQRTAIDAVEQAIDPALCTALAEPARLEIVKVLLRLASADVGEISVHLHQDRSVVSRHLKTLREAGVVCMTRDGRRRIYALDGAGLVKRFQHIVTTIQSAMACCPGQPTAR